MHRPRWRRERAKASELTPSELARRIVHDLHHMAMALADARGLGRLVPGNLDVSVRFDSPLETAAEQLLTAIGERLDEIGSSRRAFRPGRVNCFQCDCTPCVHDHPTDPQATFKGYTATGKPEWIGFVNLLIDRRDERVERLYLDPPEVIGVVLTADELRGELLPAFGRGNQWYDVIGQVVVGLVPSKWITRRGVDERLAITFQVVRTCAERGGEQLKLNVLGLSPDEVAELSGERGGPAERLRNAIREMRASLEALNRRASGNPEQEVESSLRAAKEDLERIFKPDRHRTAHARARHRSGERPTALALRDVREAPLERFLLDAERGTVVVLGPRGRTHIFGADGRHITSMVMIPSEIERRFVRSRWRPMVRHDVESFKTKVG